MDEQRLDRLRELAVIVVRHSEPYDRPERPFAGVIGWRDGLGVGIVLARRFSSSAPQLLAGLLAMPQLWGMAPEAIEVRAIETADWVARTVREVLPAGSASERMDGAQYLRLSGVLGSHALSYQQEPAGPAAWIDALLIGLLLQRRFPRTARTLSSHMCSMATLLSEDLAELYEERLIEAAVALEKDVRPLLAGAGQDTGGH